MIDLHSHVLPNLDDGAATLTEALAIARAAVADGIEALAGTPHVRDDYPTSAGAMEAAAAELREALAAEDVPLRLLTGGEIALDRLDLIDEDELPRFGLGGGRTHLLLEFPYHGWPMDLRERIFQLQLRGFTPVLAHPERNAEVQARPGRLAPLVEAGALVQLTAASVDGRLGRGTRAASTALLEAGLAHLLASDAHTASVRGIGLSDAVAALDDGALARWLTEDVPRAIVEGSTLPPRPAAIRPRRWWQR